MAKDIARGIDETAIPWFTRGSDLSAAFAEVQAEPDGFNKFVLAAYLARELDHIALRDKYTRLAEEQGKRTGLFPDKEQWF